MTTDDKTTAGLKKGLVYVFIANALTLGLSLLTGFVLPKVLSVETYARIKDFSLYELLVLVGQEARRLRLREQVAQVVDKRDPVCPARQRVRLRHRREQRVNLIAII